MNKIYKNVTAILLMGILFFLGACNKNEFLDRIPKDLPNPENFFVNENTARMAVNSCYGPWQWGSADMLSRDMTLLLDAMTDDSYYRPGRASSTALEMWNVNSIHSNVVSWWRFPYQCINAANFAIDYIPTSSDPNFTPEKQTPYIAEAKFFRAYSYLFLTTFYGDVPLFTNTASDITQFNTPRSPKAQVLAKVIEDFIYAKDYLPNNQSVKGPPTKAAATAFLAKTYLFMKDWVKAESAAREAIEIAENNGFKMVDNYMSIWSDEGNSELLFYWSYAENDPSYGQNMTVQRLSRLLPDAFRIGINGDGWGYSLPQRDLYDAFEPGDPRREYTLYSPEHSFEIYPGPTNFTYMHEKYDATGKKVNWTITYKPGDMVEYDYRWSETGLNVRKMTNPLKDLANVRWDGMDIPVMRMAEVYLILAEALAEQGKQEALTWVNKVRARPSVNMPPKTAANGTLVDIVRHERRVELAMEGLRIFDLIRWGTIKTIFGDGTKVKRMFYSDFLPASSSLKYDKPIGNLTLDPIFPLPQTEIDQNSQINSNNPGF